MEKSNVKPSAVLSYSCRFPLWQKMQGEIKAWIGRIIWYFYPPGKSSAVAKILPLTPIDNVAEIAPYANRLRRALDDNNVRNIAVTGRFGAGKSSLLHTYFRGAKVLWISLAPFLNDLTEGHERQSDSDQTAASGKFDREELGRKLENSILQQMFYTARARELPFSRFSRIRRNGFWHYLLAAFLVVDLLLSYIAIFQPEQIWQHLRNVMNVDSDAVCIMAILHLVFSITLIVALVCDAVRRSRLIGRITTTCAEVEMGTTPGNMVFNHTVEEVIYHFQSVRYEAVIFEDLDRFSDTLIFAKLKEMNQLINASREIPWRNKPIKFIYAVRDGVLADVDRVKFFDYILPILPTMSLANSFDVFVDSLRIILGGHVLDGEYMGLIRIASQYIFDRRLIHNVCNEFDILRENLDSNIPMVKLLGIVIYKNVLPRDFDALQEGHGVLFSLFGKRNNIISRLLSEKKMLVEDLRNRLSSMDENGDEYQDAASELFELEEEMKRLAAMTLADLIRERHLDITTVYQLMNLNDGYDRDAKWHQYNQADLLFALLSRGYITEQYKHFIVTYDDAVISKEDHAFVLSCLDGRTGMEAYKIDKPGEVIGEIPIRCFETKSILNYTIINWMVTNKECPADKLDALRATMFSAKMIDVAFLNRLTEHFKGSHMFLHQLGASIGKHEASFLRAVIYSTEVDDDRKLVLLGIYLKSRPRFPNLELPEFVREFLAMQRSISQMFEKMNVTIKDARVLMGVSPILLSDVDAEDKDIEEVVDAMIATGSYKLEENMLCKLLKIKGVFDEFKWAHSCGTVLRGCGIKEFRSRLDEDFRQFINGIYLKSRENQTDDQQFIAWAINRTEMDGDMLEKFFDKQSSLLANINLVKDDEKLLKLLKLKCVAPTWENLMRLFDRWQATRVSGVVDSKWLEDFAEQMRLLAQENIAVLKDAWLSDWDPRMSEFVDSFVQGQSLPDELCLRVAERYKDNIQPFVPTDGMSKSRIIGLARLGLVKLTKDLYDRLKSKDVEALIQVVSHNLAEYFAIISDIDFDEEITARLLKNTEISQENKLKILSERCEEIVKSEQIASIVAPNIGIKNMLQYPVPIVSRCFERLSNAAIKCFALLNIDYTTESLCMGLRIIGGPFAELVKPNQTVFVPRSEVVEQLLKKLKGLGIITSYEIVNLFEISVKTKEDYFPV